MPKSASAANKFVDVSGAVAVLGRGRGGTGPPNLAQAPQIFDWFQECIGGI